MRVVAGLLLAVAVVLQLLLGGSLIFSASYQGTGGLSDVSADLVSDQQLKQMERQEDPHRQHRLWLGVALAALGLVQAALTVLAFIGRARRVVLAGTALSLVSVGLVALVHKPLVLVLITGTLLAAGLVLTLLARPQPATD